MDRKDSESKVHFFYLVSTISRDKNNKDIYLNSVEKALLILMLHYNLTDTLYISYFLKF